MGEDIRREQKADKLKRMQKMPEPLIAWYRSVKRNLPWREEPSPYHVWISEIMLQQTRIEAVKAYYTRFLAELPDIHSLAEAEEERVLKLWEGLGYYSRARNLMKAARICEEHFSGELPDSYEELRKLPGIGPYTAGAIGSIAFGLRVPAVDGNVLRVVMRYLADDSDISRGAVRKETERMIQKILPPEGGSEFNQAIMELGELICIPNGRPHCEECPLAECCLSREQDTMEQYPVRQARKARRVEERTILVMSCGSRYAIRRRPGRGLLAGMYELPGLAGHRSRQEIREWLEDLAGRYEIEELQEARHIFSHVEWFMRGWRVRLPEECPGDWFFAEAEEIRRRYPLPAAFRAYTAYIKEG